MTDPEINEHEEHAEHEEKRGLPRWKKILITAAGLMLVVGLGMTAYGKMTADEPSSSSSSVAGTQGTDGPTPSSLVGGSGPLGGHTGGQTTGQAAEAEGAEGSWAPFLVKGGFSFFLAFCVGYAIRTFLKISMLMIGFLAIGVFGLSYVGVIETVNWSIVEGWYDSFVAKVREESGGFQTFITGSLPSAGLATLGLVTGFKRN